MTDTNGNGNVAKVRMDHVERDVKAMQETIKIMASKHSDVTTALININWKIKILIAAVLLSSAHTENVAYKAIISILG